MLSTIEKIVEKVENSIVIIAILCIVVSIFLQVVSRYVVHAPLSWTEEFSRAFLIWLTFVGAALALRGGGHFALDVFLKKMPTNLRSVFEIILLIITILFLGVLFYKGIAILPIVHQQISASLRIPMSFIYLAIPVGSGFMLFHVVVMTCRKSCQLLTKRGKTNQ